MQTVRISVRKLVEFLLRSGDIAPATTAAAELEAMQQGSDVHRRLQAMAGEPYQAEVSLARSFYFPRREFLPAALAMDVEPEMVENSDPTGWFLRVEGRADGVMDEPQGVTIDEIKATYADVAALREPVPAHVAQAKCYAYLYLRGVQAAAGDATLRRAAPITVRMTYVGLDTGEVRRLSKTFWFQELEDWFFSLLLGYHRWLGPRMAHVRRRDQALRGLDFPYAWRPGQEELVRRVEATVSEGGRLYLQAPTGSGKTVGCVWPALRQMGRGSGRRLVYLTAKTIARQAAQDCLGLLNRRGARVVAVVLTARDKICPLRSDARRAGVRGAGHTTPCNPEECPYARGHFDRIGEAARRLLLASEAGAVLDRRSVREVADLRRVCPYELQMEIADWADAVVCDYNYVFSPSAAQRCLGSEPDQAVLLVDEAHNLVDRARELYSAELTGAAFARAAASLSREDPSDQARELACALKSVADKLGGARRLGDGRPLPGDGQCKGGGREAGRTSYRVVRDFGGLPNLLEATLPVMEAYLAQVPPAQQVRDSFVLANELHLQMVGFVGALARAKQGEDGGGSAGYVLYEEDLGPRGTRAKVFCADPSGEVGERLASVRASVLFSATLIPQDYYRKLLAAREEDPTYLATSAFDPKRQRVLVGGDVAMRYSRRDAEQYRRVATYVRRLVEARSGNYLVFVPSYQVLDAVREELGRALPAGVRLLAQRGRMGEREREDFLAAFRAGRGEAPATPALCGEAPSSDGHALATARPSLVGLCVLGGFFAESIDLRGDALVGVVVVGTGLPGMSAEREIVRGQFAEAGQDGFAYAYTYPGMAKVLQAAGRLIRTERDAGVVLLLDDRFATQAYKDLFPREWDVPTLVTQDSVARALRSFWRTV